MSNASEAQRCQLQELVRTQSIRGCTTYKVQQLDNMTCTQHVTQAGQVLVLVKGAPHYVLPLADTPSIHVTVGLERQGLLWLDLIKAALSIMLRDTQSQPTTAAWRDVLLTMQRFRFDFVQHHGLVDLYSALPFNECPALAGMQCAVLILFGTQSLSFCM